jgi:hypothetical protein
MQERTTDTFRIEEEQNGGDYKGIDRRGYQGGIEEDMDEE